MTTYNIYDLHKKLCPEKCLNNFWRSIDYKAAEEVALSRGETPAKPVAKGHHGSPAVTYISPVVMLAFLRWADPAKFYKKILRAMGEDE